MRQQEKIVERVVGHKAISFKDGKFVMMGVLGMPFPMSSIVLFYHLAHNYDPKVTRDIAYYVGKTQCSAALSFNHQMYGYTNKKDNIELIRQQIALIGAGNLQTHLINLKKKVAIFKNANIPFSHHYRKVLGLQKEPIDHHIRGICAGLFQEIAKHELGSEEEMVAIETHCVAKGDPACVFEVRPRMAWDKIDNQNNKLITQQMPDENYDFEEMKQISNVKTLLA